MLELNKLYNMEHKYMTWYIFFAYIFLMFLVRYLLTKKPEIIKSEIDNDIVLNYIESESNNTRFFNFINKVINPDKGDIVFICDGKWKNYYGEITKYNSTVNNYNIKLHKNLNFDKTQFPKKKLVRNRDQFIVDLD